MNYNFNIKQLEDYHVNDYYVNDMIWNLFLIVVPIVLYFLIKKRWYYSRGGLWNKILVLVLFVAWLTFLPNTAYVMTDVRHLVNYCPNTEFNVCPTNSWMPIFFFTYSLIGWISFVWLLNSVVALVGSRLNRVIASVFLLLAIPMSALGVLLGLLDRLNSWDLITRPMTVYKTTILYFTDWQLLKILIIYSVLFFVLYGLGGLFLKKSN